MSLCTPVAARTSEQKLCDRLISDLDESYTLVFIDRNDCINDQELRSLLVEDSEKAREKIMMDDWHWQAQEYGARHVMEEITTEEERELLEEGGAMFDLLDAIIERDDSDPFRDLLRNTSNIWTFTPIKDKDGDIIEVCGATFTASEEEEEEVAMVTHELERHGLKPKREQVTELLANAGYGGLLCILDCTDAEDLTGESATVTFHDPAVCIRDGLNGSGHDVEVPGTISLPRSDMRCDESGHGCSYSLDVCGLVRSRFDSATFS